MIFLNRVLYLDHFSSIFINITGHLNLLKNISADPHLLTVCLPVNTTRVTKSLVDQRRHHGPCVVAGQLVFCHIVIGVFAAGHHDEVGGDLDGAMVSSMSDIKGPDLWNSPVRGDPLG